jgi:hypothetical protein
MTIREEWIELLNDVIPGLRTQQESSDEGEVTWATEEIERYRRCAAWDSVSLEDLNI